MQGMGEESFATSPVRVAAYVAVVVFLAASTIVTSVVLTRLRLPQAPDEAEAAPDPSAAPVIRPVTSAELDGRRAELMAGGQSLERERLAIQEERQELQSLGHRIDRRWRQFPDGLPPGPAADDQFDVMNYNHRMQGLDVRIIDYNARVARYRQAVTEFEMLERPVRTAR